MSQIENQIENILIMNFFHYFETKFVLEILLTYYNIFLYYKKKKIKDKKTKKEF